MHLLDSMLQHRTIDLVKESLVDSDDEIGGDSEKVAVECSVMDLA